MLFPLRQKKGKGDKVLYRKPFRTEVENRIYGKGRIAARENKGLQGVPERLSPLAEGGLYKCLEKLLITAERFPGIPLKPDYRRLDLGRRGEAAGTDGK